MATHPAFSGAQRGRRCYVTLAFSGVPNAKHGEKLKSGYLTLAFSGPKRGRKCHVTPTFSGVPNAKRREKIRRGYLTLAFSGAQKRADLL